MRKLERNGQVLFASNILEIYDMSFFNWFFGFLIGVAVCVILLIIIIVCFPILTEYDTKATLISKFEIKIENYKSTNHTLTYTCYM